MLLSIFVVALYLLVFVDKWRFTPRVSKEVLVFLTALNALAVIWAYATIPDLNLASQVGMSVCVVALGGIVVLAPWQSGLLFVLLTAFLGGCIPYYIVRTPGPAAFFVQLLVAAPGFLLMYRYFRPMFHSALLNKHAAWNLLALVPLSFTVVHLVIVAQTLWGRTAPVDDGASVLPGVPILALRLMMIALPLITYLLLYTLFQVLNQQHLANLENLLRNTQVAALARQTEAGRQHRKQDEDFYHRLNEAIARMDRQIQTGDLSQALDLAGKIDGGLAHAGLEAKGRVYTGNGVMDAVLGDYADRAAEAGVPLTIRFSLPSGWNLDTLGLAVVLSNGLENALNACRACPPESKPVIRLITANTPLQLTLELGNTCTGPVTFDPITGLPHSRQPGHGYGTRSIAAYVKANGGTVDFTLKDGWFALRLMIPLTQRCPET